MPNETNDASSPKEPNDSENEQQSTSIPNTVTDIIEKSLDVAEE
jgi:hypothetical protein